MRLLQVGRFPQVPTATPASPPSRSEDPSSSRRTPVDALLVGVVWSRLDAITFLMLIAADAEATA